MATLIRLGCAIAIIATTAGCNRAALDTETAKRLEDLAGKMLAAGQMAEQITNGYSTIWSEAIENRTDFNQALREHRESAKTQENRKTLRDSLNSIEADIRRLHSSGLNEEAFQQLSEAFEVLFRFGSLAESPAGTMQSFNTATGELTNDLLGELARLRLHLPPTDGSKPQVGS